MFKDTDSFLEVVTMYEIPPGIISDKDMKEIQKIIKDAKFNSTKIFIRKVIKMIISGAATDQIVQVILSAKINDTTVTQEIASKITIATLLIMGTGWVASEITKMIFKLLKQVKTPQKIDILNGMIDGTKKADQIKKTKKLKSPQEAVDSLFKELNILEKIV